MTISVRIQNRIFLVAAVAIGAVGIAIGYMLSGYAKLETFKLLNIVGLFYDLLGIILLSEIVAKGPSVKKFFVDWVSGSLIWVQTIIPLGALLGTAFGYSLPSSGVAAKFLASFFFLLVLVLGVMEATVFVPKLAWFQSLETRYRMFGLILLVTGICIQLVAAFKDLNS